MTPEFIVGLDLGQANDYTAISVLQRVGTDKRPGYHVRHLERPELGTPYPKIVERAQALMRSDALRSARTDLVVDQTGVGAPVVDMLRDANLKPIAVTITGGDHVHEDREAQTFRVPKRDLVATLQALFQTERLKIAQGLALGPVLKDETLNMTIKVNPQTAHDSYEHWREGDHDDLVLATALAAWHGERAANRSPSMADYYAAILGWDDDGSGRQSSNDEGEETSTDRAKREILMQSAINRIGR